ncbi:MAG TPA: nitrate/sulfonate/bicarbonate ABC transporter ATP-binding protein [Thermoanaerobaculia bacterium]|nr:nitrate/sulfonate/bicarbonate ABC transporter ATP-binding protein [Thermoanaerobaculia bacterium]
MTATTAMVTETGQAVTRLCETRGVSQDFVMPNGSKLRALEDINVFIKPSEVVALLGPSGCGKSTILRILAGLIRPTHGSVFYRGQEVFGLTPGVSIVFQSFALYPWMTVVENVEIVLHAAGLPADERKSRAERSIRTVGLAGFEEAYPRELSGGMKQRLGIARALSINPEMLFMDEPFSHVDALTAEGLRAEVIDLWTPEGQNPSSILMVSHDIEEVVYMADRIIVLRSHPGSVRTIVENPIKRPRDFRSPESQEIVDHLREIITGAEMPDAPVAAGPARASRIEPLPHADTAEIVGLMEILDAHGGVGDIFDIAAATDREFGHVIAITKAAEMLNFVDTPKQAIVLTALGRQFTKGDPGERQAIWREQLLKLRLFQDVFALLAQRPDHAITADIVREMIIMALPSEHHEAMFDTMVRWARFGNLFAYEDDADWLSLQ